MSVPQAIDAPVVMLDGPATGVLKYHAIEYAVIDGYRPLQLDLYLPAAPTTTLRPAIVFVHGGGWSVGSRRRFGRAFRAWTPTPLELMALAGFAVVCVDYRLSAEARFPAQLHDCKAAVRWLRAHAEELHVDGGRIVAWGESAGGHLALLLGLTGDRRDVDDGLDGAVGEHLDQRSDVCAVVDWYGVTDLLAANSQRHPNSAADHDATDSYESQLVGAPVQQVPEASRRASPMTYAHAGAPPVQIHHGDADLVVPYRQSVELVRTLTELEVDVEFVTLPGTDHFWIGAPDIAAIFQASLAFANNASLGTGNSYDEADSNTT